jgi:hypothetical protein
MTWMIYDLAVAIRSLARDLNQPFRAGPHVLFKVLTSTKVHLAMHGS